MLGRIRPPAGRVYERQILVSARCIERLITDSPDHAGCPLPRETRRALRRPGAIRHTKDSSLKSFLDLGLIEPITRALADERYATPTPIQTQTIPHVLAARDVVGIAQTGTGKTAAFALPILHRLAEKRLRPERRACRVLILSPTRELSAQITESFKTYGRYLRPSVALAIGGVSTSRQVRILAAGVEVLVATPGRLRDLLQMGALRLDRVEVFVLDEADRMLDMGFIHDIRAIVEKLPRDRQSLFFSATMPKPITDLANQMLRNPAHVAVTPAATTVESVDQRVIFVDRAGKPALLGEILRGESIDRALVFTRTKHGADRVVRALEKMNLAAEAIHGNKSQSQRERVLAAFRTGRLRTLIATDIAARGIDVDGISHVINYDLPNIPESYVHRIGRTARAGAVGAAISFCDAEERAYLKTIERLIRISIPATDRRSGRGTGERPPVKVKANHSQNGKHRAKQHQQRGNHANASSDATIASVGFMQPVRGPRQHANVRGNHRAAR
ncbi:MAG: DEAD/DEAH box helicase [Rhizobiales bacterium]|nr:DEAD/DEAH box helicase [Hyphomicrobiales bacterium]